MIYQANACNNSFNPAEEDSAVSVLSPTLWKRGVCTNAVFLAMENKAEMPLLVVKDGNTAVPINRPTQTNTGPVEVTKTTVGVRHTNSSLFSDHSMVTIRDARHFFLLLVSMTSTKRYPFPTEQTHPDLNWTMTIMYFCTQMKFKNVP